MEPANAGGEGVGQPRAAQTPGGSTFINGTAALDYEDREPDHQGKRPEQVRFSEYVAPLALFGAVLVLLAAVVWAYLRDLGLLP